MQDEFGPVHLRIEGDVERGRTFIRSAQQVRLNLLRTLEGLEAPQGAMSRVIGDGVIAQVYKYGDLQIVRIVCDPAPARELAQDAQAEVLYPDFLSGTVWFGRLDNGKLEFFRPTPRTRALFDMPAGDQALERLAVKPHPLLVDDLLSDDAEIAKRETQYTRLKPSMYSGTMKKLVQLLLGYGKFSDELSIYQRETSGQIGDVAATPFLQRTKTEGTQIQYDWRAHRTHGLTKASDGRWWLVQIYQGFGIHAMPLPLYEQTTTPQFRSLVEEIGDDDAVDVLDLFGGFPTGESFPESRLLASYSRAGLILKGDPQNRLADFYAFAPYGPWIGWAFNPSGSEAHNTGWALEADGIQTGVHFSATISIGKLRDKPTDAQEQRKRLKAGLSSVASFNAERPEIAQLLPILLKKAEWCDAGQLAQFAIMDSVEQYLAFDQIEVDPIAPSTIRVGQVGRSRMGINSRRRKEMHVKFYQPGFGLMNHDFSVPALPPFGTPTFDTDATVFAFFRGNTLCTVKAWIGSASVNTVENREVGECPWDYSNTTITSSFDGAANGVYSNDIDERAASYEVVTSFESSGSYRDSGQVTIGDDILNLSRSFVRRIWQTSVRSVFKRGGGQTVRNACAFPRDMREAYFIARYRSDHAFSTTTSVQNGSRAGSIGYTTWRNLITGPNSQHPAGCGSVGHRAIWHPFVVESGPCALGGSWASVCDNADNFPIYTGDRPDSVTTVTTPPSYRFTCWFVAANTEGPVVTIDSNDPADAGYWFVWTPTDGGVFQQIHAHGNELGTATTIRHSRTIDGGFMIYGSPAILPEMFNRNWVNVGVVNG